MIVLVRDGLAIISLVSAVAGAALSMLASIVGSSMRAVVGLIGAVVGLMMRDIVGSMGVVVGLIMIDVVGLMVKAVVGSKGSVVGLMFSIRANLFLTWVSSARIAMIPFSNVRDLAKVPLAFMGMYFLLCHDA